MLTPDGFGGTHLLYGVYCLHVKCANGRLFNSWVLRDIIKIRGENHALVFVLFPNSCDSRSPMPRTVCSAETCGCLGLQKRESCCVRTARSAWAGQFTAFAPGS